jgi:hypothetical protein
VTFKVGDTVRHEFNNHLGVGHITELGVDETSYTRVSFASNSERLCKPEFLKPTNDPCECYECVSAGKKSETLLTRKGKFIVVTDDEYIDGVWDKKRYEWEEAKGIATILANDVGVVTYVLKFEATVVPAQIHDGFYEEPIPVVKEQESLNA